MSFSPDNQHSTNTKPMLDQNITVIYKAEDHWSVLTQRYGSLWAKVWPYCLFNVFLMVTLSVLRNQYFPTLHISSEGHTFVSVVVGFLLVSRVQTVLSRYAEARGYLMTMFGATRELVSDACVLTSDNTSDPAKLWRIELTYRMLLLLRTSMAVVDYPTDFIAAWKVPELQGEELQDILLHTYVNPSLHPFRHEGRSEFEESMRVPVRVAYLLKQTLKKHEKMLIHVKGNHTDSSPNTGGGPLPITQFANLMKNVDAFMNGYYGMRKILTTPIPFPLVQMARTFVFAYVFSIPFALLSDESPILAHCFEVFLLTYGFVGLELVAIELDNPFGDDENDFDNLALAKACMEDAYLILLDTDGFESAWPLRQVMGSRSTTGGTSRNERMHPFPTTNLEGADEETYRSNSSTSSSRSVESTPLIA